MNRLILSLICVFMFFAFHPAAAPATEAANEIAITINGGQLTTPQPPAIVNNRTLVPLRAIFEALGANIQWDGATQTVTAIKGDLLLTLQIGNTVAVRNGSDITIDVSPQIINSSTMVPARFVAESLGANVGWDAGTRTVVITTPTTSTPGNAEPTPPPTAETPATECATKDVYLADKNFSYTAYDCATLALQIAAGDQLIHMIGHTFFENDHHHHADLDIGFTFAEELSLGIYIVDRNVLVNFEKEDVPSNFIDLQNDTEKHLWQWDTFIKLIPFEYRADVSEFSVFVHDGTLGYVAQYAYEDEITTSWIFGMNMIELETRMQMLSTLVHEFAHLVTLGQHQVTPYVSAENCLTLNFEEGCTNADSYIQQFYEQFWVEIYEQVNGFEGDPELLEDFYDQRQDQFVNDYAATSLKEDIAESFAYFVLLPKPASNSVRDDKLLFFYDYPELVEMRVEILTRLLAIVQTGDWDL